MEGQKQHYVPKVYLKEFTKGKNGYFFASGPKPNFARIMERHINVVCKRGDFYTLSDDSIERLNISDKLFIERNAFTYENRILVKIIEMFKERRNFLDIADANSLINIYLSFKQRNPYYRNCIKEDKIIESVERNIELLKQEREWVEEKSGLKFEKFVDSLINRFIVGKDLSSEVYREILFNRVVGEDSAMNNISKNLIRLNIVIYEPLKSTDYFLTSDNPGYTISENQIFNTHFSKFRIICFPLSSKLLVTFQGLDINHQSKYKKEIVYKKVDSKIIDAFNFGTIKMSNDYCFCEDRNYLKQIFTRISLDDLI